jgi:hypothetical protein
MSGVLKLTPPPDTDVDYSSAIGEFAIGLSPIEGWVPAFVAPVPAPYPASINAGLNRFYDTIQTRLAGITQPVIDLELASVVEEFCFRSTYFSEQVFWQMQPGVDRLVLTPYSLQMETIWVVHVEGLVNYKIDPPATLVDMYPPVSVRTGSAIMILKPRSLDFVKQGAVPALFTTWFEPILDGVLFRLFGIPAKPWSSPQFASYHGTRYWQGVNRARDIAERLNSNQQSPFRRFPYWAHGRRKQ